MSEGNKNLITELKALRTSSNVYIIDAVCIISFFLLHYFYFETEMFSNYLGLLFVFALSLVRGGYSKSVKVNKRVNSIIDGINTK